DHHLHVQWQTSRSLQQSFQRLEVNVHLPLVICRTASEKVPLSHGGLECGTRPQVQGLRWLPVVVSIKKARWFSRCPQRFPIHKRMHFRGDNLDILEPCAS